MKLYNRHTIPEGVKAQYIGRGTIWGNKFKVGEEYTQEEAALAYRRHLARCLAARDKNAINAVTSILSHEAIVCSCHPRPCHGDCFIEIADIWNNGAVPIPKAIRRWVTENGSFPGPATDGVDHINMYSKAKTKLGKKLTNMSNLPVYIDGAGQFLSMEGYWYWLSTGCRYNELMDMSGFEAKIFGRDKTRVVDPDFKDKIRYALWQRFEQNPTIKSMFVDSTLPFKHYYHYGDSDDTVTYPLFDWITEEIELLRSLYKGEKKACIIAGSRTITDKEVVRAAVEESGFKFDVVVCGKAKGVDTLGEELAKEWGKPVRYFTPLWDIHGKRAGFMRNDEMQKFSHMAVVCIENNSKGSTQMAQSMTDAGKDVYVKELSS